MNLSVSIKEKILKGHPFVLDKIRGTSALKAGASENTGFSQDDQLYRSIDNARSELEMAVLTFNELTDEKAIDYASYNLLAARARYSYLLQLAKEKKLSL